MMPSTAKPSASGAMKPAYLIVGADEGKIDAALTRLRARGEREGGAGARRASGRERREGRPTIDALLAAIPAMSLIASRRYLLADGVERWTRQAGGARDRGAGATCPRT